MKTLFYTSLALLAFAGNSILCRLALGEHRIDAASFTIIRLASGIAILFFILYIKHARTSKNIHSTGSWLAALLLFTYATSFSYGYLTLDTGIGALILFSAVQFFMVISSLASGNKLNSKEGFGLAIAFSGFVYLLMPNLSTPSMTGFVLMTISGLAWAGYTLIGKNSINPLTDTAYNFLRTSPFIVCLLLINLNSSHVTKEGIVIAITSGTLASGVGYYLWFAAVRQLKTIQAAVVQLFVPVLATAGGIVFSSEIISPSFILSAAIILTGTLLVILNKANN